MGRSVDWLLTGVEATPEVRIEKADAEPPMVLLDEDRLFARVREIVREEMAHGRSEETPIQDLGEADAFDLDAAMAKYEGILPVVDAWLKHDGLAMPEEFTGMLAHIGHAAMTTKQRREMIADWRRLLERHIKKK